MEYGKDGRSLNQMNHLKTSLVAALLLSVLSACYLPVRFDAEINLGRTGFYDIEFDGYLAKLPLTEDIGKGTLSEAEQEQKIGEVLSDLRRDASTQEAEYVKNGLFRLKWKKEGDMLKSKMVAFIRRNERIFSIKYLKDQGRMVLEGRKLSTKNAERVANSGLGTEGELRVRTDAKVLDHNATEVRDVPKDKRTKIYVWKIKSLIDPAPRLTAVLR